MVELRASTQPLTSQQVLKIVHFHDGSPSGFGIGDESFATDVPNGRGRRGGAGAGDVGTAEAVVGDAGATGSGGIAAGGGA